MRYRRLQALGVIFAIVAVAALFVDLGAQIAGQLRTLRAAPNDSLSWALSQIEVELLTLLRSVEKPEPDSASIKRVRLRFDVFYSRLATAQQMTAPQAIPDARGINEKIGSLFARFSALAPLVDAPGPLTAERSRSLAEALAALAPDARRIALDGVEISAVAADRARATLSKLVFEAGLAALLLIAALALSALALLRQRRMMLVRSAEIETISQRYASTIDASLDAIIVSDVNGTVLDFNSAAERTFGYTRNAALGSTVAQLIVPDHHREAHAEGLRRFARTGEHKIERGSRLILDAKRADGEVFPVELALGSANTPAGMLFIAYIRDISEQVRAREELTTARDNALAAARAKSQFLAVMSHEMRTPLNGVLAVLDLLATTELNERQRRFVATATASGELLQNHINDVLEITHFDAGQLRLHRTDFRLERLLSEVADMNCAAAKARGNRLVLACEIAGAALHEDRLRLSQVIVNLVSNAIKFTKDGEIVIGARAIPWADGGQGLEIDVRDTGVGIAPEDQRRIFEDFVSIDGAYTRTTRGYGLGLAICRRIMRALGGQIGLESQRGQGSRFWIHLPLRPVVGSRVVDESAAPAEAVESGGLSVLVVEDNETNRLVAREMLVAAGCEVVEARDGVEGVELASGRTFDLILMDVSMPRMDGLEATRKIRADSLSKSRATPIVGLTAHAAPEERENLLLAGMESSLIKPLRKRKLDQLLAQIRNRQMDAKAQGPADEALVDAEVFQEICEVLPPDILAQRLLALSAEIEGLQQAFAGFDASGDAEALARAAHKLAGACAVFGAEPLRRALGAIETACKAGQTGDLPVPRADALALAARTGAILKRLAAA